MLLWQSALALVYNLVSDLYSGTSFLRLRIYLEERGNTYGFGFNGKKNWDDTNIFS